VNREYVEPDPSIFGRKRFSCHVRPRYSCGSGAMVHDHVAIQVAHEEKGDYEAALSGIYGEAQRRRAELLVLRGIAVAMAETGSGKNFRWLCFDLVTGEYYRRHDDAGIERLGFKPYRALSERARFEINQTGNDGDYERTFWKFENLQWTQYEPEIVRRP
jgi:hypothetical protein